MLALSTGQTLSTIALIVSGMVSARVLSKHDYATLKQTMLAYNFAAPLLMLGLPNALYYFLPRENNRKRGVLIDNLLLLLVLALIFSIFLLAGGYKILALRFNNPDLGSTLKWMIPYPLYVMPAAVLGAVLLSQNKTYILAKYNIISSVLITVLTIIGTLITRDYSGPLYVQIYFPLLLLPVILYLCFKSIPGSITAPDVSNMVEMIKYSVPLGLAGMLGVIMLETNKFVVSAMCSPEEFANYVNGAVEIPLISVITGSISSVILVDMTKYIHAKENDKALELFKKASVNSAAILFPVMIFLLASGKLFIVTIYSEKYLESVIPFYIYLFVLPIRIVVYGSALMALGQSKIILIRSIIDLAINTLLSIVLVHFWGYLGAAIATLLTLYFWTVPYNLVKIGKGFNVNGLHTLPFKKLGKIMLLCILTVPLAFFHLLMNNQPPFVGLIMDAMFYFPVIGFILLKKKLIVLPPAFNKYVPRFIQSQIIPNE